MKHRYKITIETKLLNVDEANGLMFYLSKRLIEQKKIAKTIKSDCGGII
jgi:hypothetical protein